MTGPQWGDDLHECEAPAPSNVVMWLFAAVVIIDVIFLAPHAIQFFTDDTYAMPDMRSRIEALIR